MMCTKKIPINFIHCLKMRPLHNCSVLKEWSKIARKWADDASPPLHAPEPMAVLAFQIELYAKQAK